MDVHVGTERSWCHIDDGVRALLMALKLDGGLYNIGRDEPIDTTVLAQKIVVLANAPYSLIKESIPGATIIPVKRASFAKAKRDFGWEAKISLNEGLARLIKS
jgi:nucleoside-diphosphate-sugar epimerase